MKHTENNNEADPIALKIADIPVRNTLSPSFHPTELNPEQSPQYLRILSSYPLHLPLIPFIFYSSPPLLLYLYLPLFIFLLSYFFILKRSFLLF